MQTLEKAYFFEGSRNLDIHYIIYGNCRKILGVISQEKQIALMVIHVLKVLKTVSIVLLTALQNFARCQVNTLLLNRNFFLNMHIKKKKDLRHVFFKENNNFFSLRICEFFLKCCYLTDLPGVCIVKLNLEAVRSYNLDLT